MAMPKKFQRSFLFSALLTVSVLTGSLLIAWSPVGNQLENLTVDWRFRSRAKSDPPADPRILVISIDEDSLKEFGRWPWPRRIHAQLLHLLTKRAPKAIAFDFMFTEPSADPGEDSVFADQLLNHPGAITGASAERILKVAAPFDEPYIGNSKAIAKVRGDIQALSGADNAAFPVQSLAESSLTGFVNSDPGPDGIRRDLPMVVRCGARVYPSLVLQTLIAIQGVDADSVEVELGRFIKVKSPEREVTIPIDRRGMFRINYRSQDSFQGMGYSSLFDMAALADKGQPWPENFPPVKGQALVIGQTSAGLTDLSPSPLQPVSPLVMVHVNALNNILKGDYIQIAPNWPIALGWLLFGFGTVLLLRHAPVWAVIAVPLLVTGLYAGAAFLCFAKSSFQLPIFWPAAGFLILHSSASIQRLVLESRAKARIKGMFGTYVAPTVVEQMIASGEEPKLGGSESEITAFFSDIAGFSSFSEQLTPHQLVALMNEYLTEMTDLLHEHGGTLDKFIGDAIVGMFGAPIFFKGHAYEACCAAAAIQRRQLELCEVWARDKNLPPSVSVMRTRIGLNSGRAIIGNMGSRRRFNYTMMGDTVNLAARTESGAKTYGVYTMVTNETRSLARAVKDDLHFRYLDRLIVKGRTQPVQMYELVEAEANLTPEMKECLERYEHGIQLYLGRKWDAARSEFVEASKLERFPKENPSIVMSRRCLTFKADPPGDEWQGEYVMSTK
jgi:adenylate cyclase